uniref:Uncharacterized protein n=1 Tax=Arundo donax TaxID=35708 RepID=A0A0A9AMW2_ARUDO
MKQPRPHVAAGSLGTHHPTGDGVGETSTKRECGVVVEGGAAELHRRICTDFGRHIRSAV